MGKRMMRGHGQYFIKVRGGLIRGDHFHDSRQSDGSLRGVFVDQSKYTAQRLPGIRAKNGVGRPPSLPPQMSLTRFLVGLQVKLMHERWLAANIARLRRVNPERFA